MASLDYDTTVYIEDQSDDVNNPLYMAWVENPQIRDVNISVFREDESAAISDLLSAYRRMGEDPGEVAVQTADYLMPLQDYLEEV